MKCKCLSLTQPWAELVALGAKKLETRSWSTNYRGPLAIHAAKRFPPEARLLCHEQPFRSFLERTDGTSPENLPLGAIIAVVDMTGCFATPGEGIPWQEHVGDLRRSPDEPERSFGDYSPGRFAWRLANVRRLDNPVPFKGSLGLFDIPWSVEELLQRKEE